MVGLPGNLNYLWYKKCPHSEVCQTPSGLSGPGGSARSLGLRLGAQFGVLLRSTPHNYTRSGTNRFANSQIPWRNLLNGWIESTNSTFLIGCLLRKHPDTLNPNGSSIIRLLGLLTEPAASCGTGALQGPLCHKSIFAEQLWGEPAPPGPSPHTPLLHPG